MIFPLDINCFMVVIISPLTRPPGCNLKYGAQEYLQKLLSSFNTAAIEKKSKFYACFFLTLA